MALLLAATAAPTRQPPARAASAAILVQNLYYPRPGRDAQVLATRIEASAVRRRLGLATGTVLLRRDGRGAFVIWECRYPSMAARRLDADRAERSPAFSAVQRKMAPLLRRFERRIWEWHAE